MSTVKNFSFIVYQHSRGLAQQVVCRMDTTARTMAEAQADLRHHLRVHHPEVLDDLAGYGYNVEVNHV